MAVLRLAPRRVPLSRHAAPASGQRRWLDPRRRPRLRLALALALALALPGADGRSVVMAFNVRSPKPGSSPQPSQPKQQPQEAAAEAGAAAGVARRPAARAGGRRGGPRRQCCGLAALVRLEPTTAAAASRPPPPTRGRSDAPANHLGRPRQARRGTQVDPSPRRPGSRQGEARGSWLARGVHGGIADLAAAAWPLRAEFAVVATGLGSMLHVTMPAGSQVFCQPGTVVGMASKARPLSPRAGRCRPPPRSQHPPRLADAARRFSRARGSRAGRCALLRGGQLGAACGWRCCRLRAPPATRWSLRRQGAALACHAASARVPDRAPQHRA